MRRERGRSLGLGSRLAGQALQGRNVIERCYCRLKDFRRVATRYNKLAQNYFSTLCLVAAVAYWL
jgi:transposase